MYLDLTKTLKRIEKALEGTPDGKRLQQAYDQTMRLRSQLLSTIYDMDQFEHRTEGKNRPEGTSRTEEKRTVTLVIPEPLPARKELTSAVEEHWITMLQEAIAEESKTGIPYFERAFVMIQITTPRGSRNHQVWDTSNRAINVIINNLKGIFFEDDNFRHMACGIVADWGENGQTIIRICELEDLKNHPVFGLESKNL